MLEDGAKEQFSLEQSAEDGNRTVGTQYGQCPVRTNIGITSDTGKKSSRQVKRGNEGSSVVFHAHKSNDIETAVV
jgi:hypothetical protein